MLSGNVGPTLAFFGKADNAHCARALEFCRRHFDVVFTATGTWGDAYPEAFKTVKPELIVSFLSRWILREEDLRAAKYAINFHPASPDFPGFGGASFAIYERAADFGVTCHHMDRRVDSGRIIAVQKFPILGTDNVASLLQRTYDHLLTLLYNVLIGFLRHGELPTCDKLWSSRILTRKHFDELRAIDINMDGEEVQRRVRATRYDHY